MAYRPCMHIFQTLSHRIRSARTPATRHRRLHLAGRLPTRQGINYVRWQTEKFGHAL
jgi:hypothetical protein